MDIELLDGNGNRIERPEQNQPGQSGGGGGGFDAAAEVARIFGGTGMQAGETDVATLASKNPEDRAKFLEDLAAQRDRRSGSTSHREYDSQSAEGNALYGSGTGNATNTPTGMLPSAARAFSPASNPRAGLGMPGTQFDDPYSNLYEQTARQYLERLTGQNSEFDRLMGLISKQIDDLSNSPGYSPQELALLNTQSFEPIERMRQQSQKNVLQRASARGVLPSSGIVEDEAQEQDRFYDQMRTVANRDLSINALNQQQADQMRAIQLAQLGVDVPNMQGSQAMQVANALYQMPRNALMDSLAVLQASSPQAGIGSLIQLMQLQQQQAQYNQQNDAAFWGNLGRTLPDILDRMGL